MTGNTVRGKFLGVRTLQVHFRHTTVKSNLIISSLSPKFLIGQLVLPADLTVFLRQLMMNTFILFSSDLVVQCSPVFPIHGCMLPAKALISSCKSGQMGHCQSGCLSMQSNNKP